MKFLAAILFAGITSAAFASEEIPIDEHGFVDRMKTADKAEIVAKLGEPAAIYEVKDEETGEVMGAIWHYHYLNVAENGEYYKTTELDFIGDRVTTVIFSTSDTSEATSATLVPSPEAVEEF